MKGLTLSEAVAVLDPPMPRRELARRLKEVAPVGTQYRRRGRPAALYPVAALMRVHADWVHERAAIGERSRRVPEFRTKRSVPDG